MFEVLADGVPVYVEGIDELNIINPVLDMERNKAGTFEFSIAPEHPSYNTLKKMKTVVTVKRDGHIIFRGRILNDASNFHNIKRVTCEGALAYLNDTVQRPYEYTGDIAPLFTQFITAHNAQVADDRKFVVGNITVTDPNAYVARSDTQYLTTWQSINQKLINTHGGSLSVRYTDTQTIIDYVAGFVDSNQPITFGDNLLDLAQEVNGADIATAIIPLGAKVGEGEDETRLTIASVNGGVDYVFDQASVTAHGWIFKIITWDDVTVAENLKTKAITALDTARQFVASIDVTAVDLSVIQGLDAPYASFDSFAVGQRIDIVSVPHGIDTAMMIQKLSLNLTSPASNKLTIGETRTSLTESTIKATESANNLVNRIETVENNVTAGIKQATEEFSSMIDQSATEIKSSVAETYYTKTQIDDQTDAMIIDITDNYESAIEQSATDITASVSETHYTKDEVDTISGEVITGVTTSYESFVQQSATAIMSTVTENYPTTADVAGQIASVESKITQSADSVDFEFSAIRELIDDVDGDVGTRFAEISKYIRFVGGNILLGEVGNQITLTITPNRISFRQNNVEVAYFSNNKLYVTDGEFLNSLTIGKFGFTPRSNGSLSLGKVK